MNQTCPKCGQRVTRWQYIEFLRLVSSHCRGCGALLGIDDRGRGALWGFIIGSVFLGAIVAQIIPPSIAYPVLVIAGMVAGVLVAARIGTVGISVEDDGDRGPER